MHITIVAFGTHGDVQPMVALGKGLQAAGHRVRLIAGENSAVWVRSHGLECVGTVDVQALMHSDEMLRWMENPRKQVTLLKRLLRQHRDKMLTPLRDTAPHSDLILSGFTSEPFVQAIREKYGVRQVNVPLQPYRPTRSGAAAMLPVFPRRDSLLNLWLGRLGEYMVWSISGEHTNHFRASLGLPPQTAKIYNQCARATPTVFGFSPHVIPLPPDWGGHTQAAGYWFLDHPADYQPPDRLASFLAAGEKPIYVGFGSMSNRNPEAMFRLACDALTNAEQRGVLAAGWSGAQTQELPEHILALDSVPHSWLFPRMAGVVHHGGAGTTAAGLRAGVPSLVIPHAADQPFWGRRLHELGVGTAPIPRRKLTLNALTQGIRALVDDSTIRERAADLGSTIRSEQGIANAVRMIEHAAQA